MSRNFGEIKTNVGNNVQDTTATFLTILGTYINDAYEEVLERVNWDAIDEDYTVTTTAGTADYALPSDFGSELYVYDQTNLQDVPFITMQELETNYPSTLATGAIPERYSIYSKVYAGSRYTYIKFHQIPTSTIVYKVPYIIGYTALSADSDNFVISCERAVTLKATADAWRYKRQFGKAMDYENLFEKALTNLIWKKENQANRTHLFNVKPYSRETV